MDRFKLNPVVKCAGGKTQLLPILKDSLPSSYNTYYEPFVGGAALLFSLKPKRAVINDTNKQLMNLYRQIKENRDLFLEAIAKYDSVLCTEEYYNKLRNLYNEKIENNILDIECAALFVWINKHCFNGLYRVNSKGLFNVPYNHRVTGVSVDIENIKGISEYLNNNDVTMTDLDFESSCESVKEGDFVYFDSPYIPVSETSNFTSYTKNGFDAKDHKRLADLFRHLDFIGAKLMLSNNDVPLVHELYAGFNIKSFPARRMINRDADKRTGREVLITNY